jgi:hypothetical protein
MASPVVGLWVVMKRVSLGRLEMGVGEEAGGLGPEAVLEAVLVAGCGSQVSGIYEVVMVRG